jgi:hypothetical protein
MIMRTIFDIDIDTATNTDRKLYGIRAMIYNTDAEKIMPHPSGVYLENVPVDKKTDLAAFDYGYGNAKGFMKVDILHNTVYDAFRSKQEIYDAIDGDIDWDLFKDQTIVESLPHVGKHFDIVSKVTPRSVEDLADILALIRPGKANLLSQYLKHKQEVRRQLYARPKEGIYFKKSHAISYALMITCLIHKKYHRGIRWK